MISYAQNFEDVMLARLFEGQRGGFYVDVGAAHPTELSVTRWFYDLGWRGINIEPIPQSHALFVRERPRDENLNLALGERAGEMLFHEVTNNPALSTFDAQIAARIAGSGETVRTYPVRVATGDEILAARGLDRQRIDFLKIDVEGHEAAVLRGLDLRRFRPRVLVVEAIVSAGAFPGWARFHEYRSTHGDWEPGVLAAGYRFAHFDGISRFYVAEEEAEALLPRFAVPPSIYDDIVVAREMALRENLVEERDAAAALLASERKIAAAALHVEHELVVRAEKALEQERAARATVEKALWVERNKALRERVLEIARHVVTSSLLRLASGKPPPPLPKISLVVPVFNTAAYIAETLETVLRQEYPALEVLVIDGGSTDGTLDIVREYESRTDLPQRIALVVSERDGGMYDAVGKGLERATGDVFCYLNADDLLEAGALMSVGRHFAAHPRAMVVYHEDSVLVDGWKYANARQPEGIDVLDLLNGHILFQDGVFFRRAAYEAIGGIRRDLRVAGDYDLWLRLAGRFRFDRRDGHMSCFRIRPGQLSSDMPRYHEEQARSRRDFLATIPAWRRAAWAIHRRFRWRWRALRARLYRSRLLYPIDFGNLPPPPAAVPPGVLEMPRSPIDGRPAERVLFSSMDTRFGDRELSWIYLDARHGISIAHPHVPGAKLDDLYRRNYSSPPSEIRMPEGTSPYRMIDRMPFWEKALQRLPLGGLAWMVLLRGTWKDTTMAELRKVLRAAGTDVRRPLRFLDVGCFEGRLLDEIREKTPWSVCGLEPNASAVGVARQKGHEVFQGHAAAIAEVMPAGRAFDVIHLGQSIEHMDDPLTVLRRVRMLLAPGGVLVMSTPNLDSRQIDWWGPTWAHWHAPYHRHIFSRAGLRALAHHAGLHVRVLRTFSHPYWTAMSIAQNWVGLGGSVSHAVPFHVHVRARAQRADVWSRLLWNPLGRGDYSYVVLSEAAP